MLAIDVPYEIDEVKDIRDKVRASAICSRRTQNVEGVGWEIAGCTPRNARGFSPEVAKHKI